MAKLSNINDLFAVESTGAIKFNDQPGNSGQILKSNGNTSPTWVDQSTIVGDYVPIAGNVTIEGPISTDTGIALTVGGVLTGTTATFTGIVTTDKIFVAKGQNIAHTASSIKVSQESTIKSQIRCYGADASTAGTLELVLSASDGAPSYTALAFDNTANATFAGKIVGQDDDSVQLELKRTSSGTDGNTTIKFVQPLGDGYFGVNLNGDLSFGTAANLITNNKFKVTRSGNATFAGIIGVNGSTTANVPITATTSSGYEDVAYFKSAGTNINSRISLFPTGTGNGAINSASNSLLLQTSGTTALTLDSSQNATFGGTLTLSNSGVPTLKLNCTDTSLAVQTLGSIEFNQNDPSSPGAGVVARINSVNESTFTGEGALTFQTGSSSTITERMRIKSDGVITFSKTANTTTPVASINHASNDFVYFSGGAGGGSFGDDSHSTRMIAFDSDYLRFDTAGSEKMRIDSSGRVGIGGPPTSTVRLSTRGLTNTNADFSFEAANSSGNSLFLVRSDGNVGIGTTSPDEMLTVKGGNIRLESTSAGNNGILRIYDSNTTESGQIYGSAGDLKIYSPADVLFNQAGKVGIGIIAPGAILDIARNATKTNTGTSEIMYIGTSNEASNYATLQVYTVGAAAAADRQWNFQTIEQGVANAGNISFQPSGGKVGIGITSPYTKLQVAGDISLNIRSSASENYIGRLGGATTWTYGNRIGFGFDAAGDGYMGFYILDSGVGDATPLFLAGNNGGRVGIGETAPAAKLDVKVASNEHFLVSDSLSTVALKATNDAAAAYVPMSINGSTLAINADSGGTFLVGSTSLGLSNNGFHLYNPNTSTTYAEFVRTSTTDASANIYISRANDANALLFYRNDVSATVGSVSVTTSATSYNTSSDYRLKENVVEMTGALDRVSQLKPSRFNFIADADKTVDGFLAHEVQEIVPEAITGEKDAVDKDGNPEYQGIDQSKLVPLLVGAIQELKAEIETLKTQINK